MAKDLLKSSPEEVAAMDAVFTKVQDKENWKNPINATVELTEAERAIVEDAVIFYAGCSPTVTDLGNGKYRVEAIGYYMAVGA